jgi:hypothetical protein
MELLHTGATLFDRPGDIYAGHDRKRQAGKPPQAALAKIAVHRIDAGGAHAHQHLPFARPGSRHLSYCKDFWRPVTAD